MGYIHPMLPDQPFAQFHSPSDTKGLDRRPALDRQDAAVIAAGGSNADRRAAAFTLTNIFELGDLWRSLMRVGS